MEEEMRPSLSMVKLEEERLKIVEGSEGLRADFLRPAYHWILQVYGKEFKGVKDARAFCSEETWDMYDLLGEEDLVEVRDFRRALNTFRMAVVSRKRPDYFKVTKRTKLLKQVK